MGSVVDRLAELFRQARMAGGWDDEAVAHQALDALGLDDNGFPIESKSPNSLGPAADPRVAQRRRHALAAIMVGGNHLALLIGADHPPYTASHEDAQKHYYPDRRDAYEAWCCWRTIMEARDALGL